VKRLILLADDSPTIQRIVTQIFTGGDFEVVSVSNGDAAVRKFEEIHPDIVLADIFMPGKTGYEVCAAVKKHPERGDTPVVLLAGAFDAFDDEAAKNAGAAAHITKPFEPQALVSLVTSLTPKGSERPRPAQPPREEKVAPASPPPPVQPIELRADVSMPLPKLTLADPITLPVTPPEPPPSELPAAQSAQSAEPAEIAQSTEPETTQPAQPTQPAPSIPAPVAKAAAAAAAPSSADSGDLLGLQDLFKPAPATVSDAEIDRIAERVIQKLSTQVIENVAWDVVPDITTKVLKEELKRQS
jgi:CheY-like chemotaxis protein